MARTRLEELGRRAIRALLETYGAWRDDRTIRLGAGLAYYGLFSLASVLTLSLGMVRVVTRRSETQAYLAERFEDAFGDIGVEVAQFIAEQLDGSGGVQLGLIGLGSLLVTGSLFFIALDDAFKQIWKVPVRTGIWSSVRRRAVGLLVLFAAALTLVASLVVYTVSGLLEAIVPGSLPGFSAVAELFASTLSWLVLAIALVMLFRFLPPARVGWRPAIICGVATGALLVVGTAMISWYLRTFGASSLTGAASAVLGVLVWIYYEAQILLAGAQMCKILSATAPVDGSPDP
jgi:membrane protein